MPRRRTARRDRAAAAAHAEQQRRVRAVRRSRMRTTQALRRVVLRVWQVVPQRAPTRRGDNTPNCRNISAAIEAGCTLVTRRRAGPAGCGPRSSAGAAQPPTAHGGPVPTPEACERRRRAAPRTATETAPSSRAPNPHSGGWTRPLNRWTCFETLIFQQPARQAAAYCGYKDGSDGSALRQAKKLGRIRPVGRRGGNGPLMGDREELDRSLAGAGDGTVTTKTRSGSPQPEGPEHDTQEVQREEAQQPPVGGEPLPGGVFYGRRRSIRQGPSSRPVEGEGSREEVGKPCDDQESRDLRLRQG